MCACALALRITIVGQLVRDAGTVPAPDERGFRDAQRPVLRLGGTLTKPLLISGS